jgi:hypothetical protein
MTDRNPMTLTARYTRVQYMYKHTCRVYARKDPGEIRERNVNPPGQKGLTFHTYMCELRSRGLNETIRKMSGVAILRMRRRRLAWAEHGGGGTNRSDLQRAIAAAIYR